MKAVPVLSYGMGVDSTSVLLRLIREPAILREMGFELSDLVVITSMVGNEFGVTGELVREHILPLLREYGVRFVQVARAGATKADGYVVLSDSRRPTELYMDGAFKLSDEYHQGGTGPETSGRKCSIKMKGDVMDAWFEDELGPDVEMIHGIGYAKGEERRAERDDVFAGKRTERSPERRPWHPLLDWGWDRADCIAYIAEQTDVPAWPKSCCVFCPFSGPKADPAGQVDHLAYLDRLEAAPEEGATALLTEFNAMSFNHRQCLYNRAGSLLEALRREGKVRAVAAFERVLGEMEWALYRVRRVQSLTAAGTNVRSNRSVEKLETGTRDEVEARLAELGDVSAEGGIPKVFSTRRRVELSGIKNQGGRKAKELKVEELELRGPVVEEFFVAAPSLARDKANKVFERSWAAAVAA